MKFIKSVLFVLCLGLLCANLAISLENHVMIGTTLEELEASSEPSELIEPIELIEPEPIEPSVLDATVIEGLSRIYATGYQQRTLLMQRILCLEHAHQMHDGTPVRMCPLCNPPTPPRPERVATGN